MAVANLPFLDVVAPDPIAKAVWDEDSYAHRRFFAGLSNHLAQHGRAYICQASFGPLRAVARYAKAAGFASRLIGQMPMFGDIPEAKFLAFELLRRNP